MEYSGPAYQMNKPVVDHDHWSEITWHTSRVSGGPEPTKSLAGARLANR